jgi:hypothetical protein
MIQYGEFVSHAGQWKCVAWQRLSPDGYGSGALRMGSVDSKKLWVLARSYLCKSKELRDWAVPIKVPDNVINVNHSLHIHTAPFPNKQEEACRSGPKEDVKKFSHPSFERVWSSSAWIRILSGQHSKPCEIMSTSTPSLCVYHLYFSHCNYDTSVTKFSGVE